MFPSSHEDYFSTIPPQTRHCKLLSTILYFVGDTKHVSYWKAAANMSHIVVSNYTVYMQLQCFLDYLDRLVPKKNSSVWISENIQIRDPWHY